MYMDTNTAPVIDEKVSVLCNNMNDEIDNCRKLLELSKSEQQYLMKNDIENLSRNTDQMKTIIDALKKAQDERRTIMADLAETLGIDPKRVSINRIGKMLDEDQGRRLRETGKDLVRMGERLYRLNHNTIYLIEFSLDLLNQQSNLWAKLAAEQDKSYGAEGRQRDRDAVPVFIQERV